MAGKRCIIHSVSLGALALLSVLALAALVTRGNGAAAPAFSASLIEKSKELTDYQVTARLNPEEHTLSISETVAYSNRTGDTLNSLMLRVWLNAFQTEETSPAAAEELFDACYPEGFSPGGVTWYDVIWNGERAAWRYVNGDETAMEITIPPLADGESGTLALRCVERLPACAYRLGHVGGDYQLGNALPLLSRYEEGTWRTDEYSAVGDPFVSDCANFHLTAYLPENCLPACTAYLSKDENGAWRGDALAVRDFALCVRESGTILRARAGDTLVLSLADTEGEARLALEDARQALEAFCALYGAYPYPTLTVCKAHFPFGGMEYPALLMIGEGYYARDLADTLELTIAHETAHQWFYALVGSDQVNSPWQDEALCEYAMLRYARRRYGQGSYETLKYYRVDSPMRESIPGALTPGSPIHYFGSLSDYAAVVYGRGAALLVALDELLPRGTDDFLRAYAAEFAFGFASRAQFEAFLNQYAGMDAGPLLLDYLDTAMQP